jgi:hypothetical protein
MTPDAVAPDFFRPELVESRIFFCRTKVAAIHFLPLPGFDTQTTGPGTTRDPLYDGNLAQKRTFLRRKNPTIHYTAMVPICPRFTPCHELKPVALPFPQLKRA